MTPHIPILQSKNSVTAITIFKSVEVRDAFDGSMAVSIWSLKCIFITLLFHQETNSTHHDFRGSSLNNGLPTLLDGADSCMRQAVWAHGGFYRAAPAFIVMVLLLSFHLALLFSYGQHVLRITHTPEVFHSKFSCGEKKSRTRCNVSSAVLYLPPSPWPLLLAGWHSANYERHTYRGQPYQTWLQHVQHRWRT